MKTASPHTFHIPVLGVGYSVDAPLKVSRFGISSVMSIIDDTLLEKLREHYLTELQQSYEPILITEEDSRARRITAYCNMVNWIAREQMIEVRNSGFHEGSDLHKYYEMLPDHSEMKAAFYQMKNSNDVHFIERMQTVLREHAVPGAIDVNIMTKIDKTNYNAKGEALPVQYNDAHAALRGFANSDLTSAVIFSAGMNPRLYGYLSSFDDFFPSAAGVFRKKIIIKVSDFRSAFIQGKFLAKKGLWVSEYRIESGLNCGGHAFATDGYLLGPILEEFFTRRDELLNTTRDMVVTALGQRGIQLDRMQFNTRVTVQGGVGTSVEQNFLMRKYGVDSVGWGSPFLLVPEVMNVDEDTLFKLSAAREEDIYLSDVSPLGVPFNNLRLNGKDIEKQQRIAQEKPGSPCKKKFLSFSTEYSEKPMCTASTSFIGKKIKEIKTRYLAPDMFSKAYEKAVEKVCLCEGLIASALSKHNLSLFKQSHAAAVCPGPNLAYFSKITTLKQMVDHIYGRINLITDPKRPNLFIKELHLYIDYLHARVDEFRVRDENGKESAYTAFQRNLMDGIQYYKELIPEMIEEAEHARQKMMHDLEMLEHRLLACSLVGA